MEIRLGFTLIDDPRQQMTGSTPVDDRVSMGNDSRCHDQHSVLSTRFRGTTLSDVSVVDIWLYLSKQVLLWWSSMICIFRKLTSVFHWYEWVFFSPLLYFQHFINSWVYSFFYTEIINKLLSNQEQSDMA